MGALLAFPGGEGYASSHLSSSAKRPTARGRSEKVGTFAERGGIGAGERRGNLAIPCPKLRFGLFKVLGVEGLLSRSPPRGRFNGISRSILWGRGDRGERP